MIGTKRQTVNRQIFEKAANLGPLPDANGVIEVCQHVGIVAHHLSLVVERFKRATRSLNV